MLCANILFATVSQFPDLNRREDKKRPVFSFPQRFFCKKSLLLCANILFAAISQFPDLNRVPARYEGAAQPGELNWRMDRIHKKKTQVNLVRELCIKKSLAYFEVHPNYWTL